MKRRMMTLVLCLLSVGAWAQEDGEKRDSAMEARLDSVEMAAEMRGVAVTAQRALVTNDIDRVGYDVEHDEEAKVLTVLDLLRKVPYVTVDGDENIKVKGSGAFKIYKNGHLDPALSRNAKEIFKAMPASMVKRIEVITDPGAREDAEGVEAILNIVMKDNKKMEGVTGSLSGSYSTLLHPNVGTYLMTQFGKLTASVDYGYGGMAKRETESREDDWVAYPETGNRLTATDKHKYPGFVHYADLNMSLEIDSLNLLSASGGGYFYNLNVQGDQRIAMADASGQTLYAYDKHFWMPNYLHHSWQGRVDYEHRTHRKEERWTASYMLATTRQNTEGEETYSQVRDVPFDYMGLLTRSRARFAEHTLQLDWLRPLGRGHQLETGAKYIFRNNRSHNLQNFYRDGNPSTQATDGEAGREPDTERRFRHRTQVGALYGDYIYRQERWSARAGLRYEYSHMQGDGFHRNLNDFVPQLSAKWQMTERQSMKLGFTTSIQRPGIEYLNPAVERSPLRVQQGNASLKSNRSQMLHLIYMYMGQRLTLNLAPAIKWSDGGIGSILTTEGDVRYVTYGNVIDHRRLQMEGYVQWKPFQKTTLVANFNIGRNKYENEGLGLELTKFSGFLYGYVMQDLWWRLKFSLAGYGQVGREIGSVYGYGEPWGSGSMSLQRSFLKEDRLTVRLSANIPFSEFKGYTSRTVQGDYLAYNHEERRSRSFSLSVSYRFGKLSASVKKTETSIENDDVIGGITKGK